MDLTKAVLAYSDDLKVLCGGVDRAINEGLTLNETKQKLLIASHGRHSVT